MVAAVVAVDDAALEVRGRADDQRHAVLAELVRDALELVASTAREADRERLLLGREDVDAEMRRGAKRRQARRGACEAPQHERRIERHRAERVSGQPEEASVGTARGDDRHAGGERAERVPQIARVERCARVLVWHERVIYLSIKHPGRGSCQGGRRTAARFHAALHRLPCALPRRRVRREAPASRPGRSAQGRRHAGPRPQCLRLCRGAHAAAVLSAAVRRGRARRARAPAGDRPADHLPAAVLLRVRRIAGYGHGDLSRRKRRARGDRRAGARPLRGLRHRSAAIARGRGRGAAPRRERPRFLGRRDRLEHRRRAARRSLARRLLGGVLRARRPGVHAPAPRARRRARGAVLSRQPLRQPVGDRADRGSADLRGRASSASRSCT